ncbi:MAG: recombinase, partial [Thiohalocapsa sp.]
PDRSEPTALDPPMKDRIDKVVARAADNAAWKQAEQYLRERCDGADLTYALDSLKQAQTEATHKQAA